MGYDKGNKGGGDISVAPAEPDNGYLGLELFRERVVVYSPTSNFKRIVLSWSLYLYILVLHILLYILCVHRVFCL